jgi:hypothetical protein
VGGEGQHSQGGEGAERLGEEFFHGEGTDSTVKKAFGETERQQ